ARCLDRIPGYNHGFCFLKALAPVRIEVGNSRHAPVAAYVDPRNHAIWTNLRPVLDCIRNVRNERAGLRAYFAALDAEAPINAVRPIAAGTIQDRYRPSSRDSDAKLRAAPDQSIAYAAHRMRPIGITM